jgi:radical SAM superfamily enzyme YgiQ (UPF0313 family)
MKLPKKNKTILLLDPPLGRDERSGALSAATGRSIPYGLLSIAAVLEKAFYNIKFIDAANFNLSVQATVDRIVAIEPDYLGMTTVTLSVDRSAEVAKQLKKRMNIPIIVGGPHMSSIPNETMARFSAFDIGVIGEGERTIVELIEALENKRDLSEVCGIIFRQSKKLVRTKRRALITDLDSLPMPKWDLLPDLINIYRPSAPSYLRVPSTTIITSRGCSGRCIFCNSRAIHGKIRYFSADYVLDMINRLIMDYKLRDLSIYDDNFICNPDRVEKICKSLIDNKIDLTWSCYSRVDQGEPELFKLMKRAGCWQISYGIESGNQRILDLLNKNVTLKQIEKTVMATKQAGLRTRGFFIIGHLTETIQTIEETIDFLLNIQLDDFHFTSFTPLPGTRAYKIADQYGEFDKTWSKMNLQYPSFIPKGLTPELLDKYSKQAYSKFYLRKHIIASNLRLLAKYPKNITRLLNGLTALTCRICTNKHFTDYDLSTAETPHSETLSPTRSAIVDYNKKTPTWEWVHKHAPAARHRRRLIKSILSECDFSDCLDVGCAQPFLLEELRTLRSNISLSGCDISESIIKKNQKIHPHCKFFVMDLNAPNLFLKSRYDLVTLSEVLEHITDWEKAVENVASYSRKWILVTVPSGVIHPVDKFVGHIRHFNGQELTACFKRNGFKTIKAFHWGFPVHSAYRLAVNKLAPKKIYNTFTNGKNSHVKRFVSSTLYTLFYLNDVFNFGSQFFALFKKETQ